MATISKDHTFRPHDSLFTDEALARRLQLFLSTISVFVPANIRVTVAGGRVHLQGSVANLAQRERIEAYARRVAGVLDVWNDLTVTGRAASTAAYKPADRAQRATGRPAPIEPTPIEPGPTEPAQTVAFPVKIHTAVAV